ncbi:hypothetical protein CL616_04940 [archaeon]|nr:hypothetical protein [archaeon]
MNWDLISILIFYGILITLYLIYRKRFTVQGKIFVLYKTKLGLNLMNRFSKYFPRLQKVIAQIGIYVGFASMVFIFYLVIQETIKFLLVPGTSPPLALVFPGIKIAGAPTLSFWHWIISIFIVAVMHEFSHGLVARLYKIPIKSSGFAFLGPILAAFVEPEEKILTQKKKTHQLAVFAAGPFSNIVFAFFILLILIFAVNPFLETVYDGNGITITQATQGYPISELELPFTIYSIEGEETLKATQFLNKTHQLSPGETITLGTNKGEIDITISEHPDNSSIAFFGISGIEQEIILKEEYSYLEKYNAFIGWMKIFLLWLFLISFGIGLFNLLPLGPVDGGRMFFLLSLAIFKDEEKAKKILIVVSIFLLLLILISLVPQLNDLLLSIANIFL